MKLIALDLDGTLLNSEKTVSPRSIEILKKCKELEMRFVVATARAPRSVIQLLPEDFKQETWICYNGAEIYRGESRIYDQLISAEAAVEVVKKMEKLFPASPIMVELAGKMFTNRPIKYPWVYKIARLEDIITTGVAKILFSELEPAALEIFRHQVPEGCRLLVTDGGTLGTIMSESASKLAGIQFLCEQWGITLNEVIAFGDDFNDMEMIEQCGLGVAMGNAVDELKAVADQVTHTNDEDGVAQFLEQYLTIKAGESK